MYDLVIERYPDSKQHGDALLAAARLHDKLKQAAAAAALYQRLAKDHPQFSKLDAALYEWAWVDAGTRQAGRRRPALRAPAQGISAKPILGRRHLPAGAAGARREGLPAGRQAGRRGSRPKADDRRARPSSPTRRVREYAMFLRGQIAVAKADWPKVREAFEALLHEYPDSQRRPVAEYWIAEAYYRQGDYAAAATRLERLAERTQGKARTVDGDDPVAARPGAGAAEPMDRRLRDRRQDRKGLSQFRAAVRGGLPARAMSRQPGRLRRLPGRRTTR